MPLPPSGSIQPKAKRSTACCQVKGCLYPRAWFGPTPMHIQSGNGLMQQRRPLRSNRSVAANQLSSKAKPCPLQTGSPASSKFAPKHTAGLTAAEFHIRNRIRQSLAAYMLPVQNGFDKRTVRLDVRRQNGNIVRLPVGVFCNTSDSSSFKICEFAQRAVCRNDFD